MKKLLLITLLIVSASYNSFAKEGMWIPMLLEKLNASEMQAMGMKISAEDIYSVNKSSLKDAIIHFGGGCTAEIVSDKGLVLTNHHCGYRNIQQHSSVEHDYLTDGFWAPTMKDELTNPGLTARILTFMEDVSQAVLKGVTEDMTIRERDSVVYINSLAIKSKYKKSEFEKIDIKAFYYGNQYILMKYDVYKDVRLVGAPPSNIGKFGGDTDISQQILPMIIFLTSLSSTLKYLLRELRKVILLSFLAILAELKNIFLLLRLSSLQKYRIHLK